MIGKNKIKITGSSLPSEGFYIHETEKKLDVNKISDVLDGRLAVYRVRHFFSNEHCQKIVDNFISNPEKTPRLGEGYDGVEAYIVGASHIEKTTQQYLEAVEASEEAVEKLYANTLSPLKIFRDAFSFEKNISVRAASFNGYSAGDSKAVLWNGQGEYFLEPHDDVAQLSDPRQAGFEIQEIKRVMAVNFYAQVPAGVGALQVWNLEPDDASRRTLELTYSGYPYPVDLLHDISSMIVPVETGDLCFLNGNLIHGVLRGDNTVLQGIENSRLLITAFTGMKSNNTLIWWT